MHHVLVQSMHHVLVQSMHHVLVQSMHRVLVQSMHRVLVQSMHHVLVQSLIHAPCTRTVPYPCTMYSYSPFAPYSPSGSLVQSPHPVQPLRQPGTVSSPHIIRWLEHVTAAQFESPHYHRGRESPLMPCPQRSWETNWLENYRGASLSMQEIWSVALLLGKLTSTINFLRSQLLSASPDNPRTQ